MEELNMKCPCCGHEMTSQDRFCPNCGENNESYVETQSTQTQSTYINQQINKVPIYQSTPTQSTSQNTNVNSYSTSSQTHTIKRENSTIAVLALIFSILGGIAGLVLSIIGLSIYKESRNRSKCAAGIVLCIIWFIIGLIIGFAGL